MTIALALPFNLPYAPSIVQGYGATNNTAEPAGHGWTHWHDGVDFGSDGTNPGVPNGTPILAAGAGTVLVAADTGSSGPGSPANYGFWGFGLCVVIDHGGGIWSLYGHLESMSVTAGQGVQQGQEIALSNNTGNSQGPHLHFSVFTGNGQSDVNPLPYLSTVSVFPGQGAPTASGTATYAQVIYWAREAGIPEAQLATAAAIAMAESSLQFGATHQNSATTGCPFGSTDRGLWQINSCYWPQYDATQLLTNGQYNAVAMAAVYAAQGWHGWSTYHMTVSGVEVGDGSVQAAYHAYLGDAQAALAATPPGTTPALSDPSQAAFGTVPQWTDTTPVDTTPQLPAQKIQITAVAVNPGDLVTRPHAQSRAVLWVAGLELPLVDVSATISTFRGAGQWSGSLGLDQLGAYPGLLDALEAREQTQIIIYGGWIPGPPQTPFSIDQLEALFTGLVDPPTISYQKRSIALSGPDLSGIFANPSATLSQLPDAWVNAYSSNVVKAIVARHNTKNGGLSADVDQSTTWAGQAFDAQTRTSRQQGQTEWDVMTALAQNDGFALWMDGTTLKYKQWPQPTDPVTLDYAVRGEPPGAVTDVQIAYGKHSKRAYSIQTTAFDRASGQTIRSTLYGNVDSLDTIVYPEPAGTRKETLDKLAASLYQHYLATQLTAHISIQGAVRLRPEQPIVLRSDRIDARFTGPHVQYWPASISYKYSAKAGWSMEVVATNQPPGLQVATSTTSAAVGF